MTNEETQKAAEVMLEAAKGKKIQMTRRGFEQWMRCDPIWDWHDFDYRVAPEPFEGWANWYQHAKLVAFYSSREEAESHLGQGGRTIKVREVIDDGGGQ